MSNIYLSEALGSFVFFLIILSTGNPIMIAVGLLIGILIAQASSQGHLNPAVTGMMLMTGKINQTEALWYCCAQLAGAIAAVYWWNYVKKN